MSESQSSKTTLFVKEGRRYRSATGEEINNAFFDQLIHDPVLAIRIVREIAKRAGETMDRAPEIK